MVLLGVACSLLLGASPVPPVLAAAAGGLVLGVVLALLADGGRCEADRRGRVGESPPR